MVIQWILINLKTYIHLRVLPSSYGKTIAIKLEDALYLFECKVKRSLRGTQDLFLHRIEEINTNLKSLNRKGKLILNNSRRNYFKVDFLQGINHFEGFQIGTGGIISWYKVVPPQGFEYLLKQLRHTTIF